MAIILLHGTVVLQPGVESFGGGVNKTVARGLGFPARHMNALLHVDRKDPEPRHIAQEPELQISMPACGDVCLSLDVD